jgi:hypothetical protein
MLAFVVRLFLVEASHMVSEKLVVSIPQTDVDLRLISAAWK